MATKAIRHEAQMAVMSAALTVMYREDLPDAVRDEARKQIARIEKLFGYIPNSWSA